MVKFCLTGAKKTNVVLRLDVEFFNLIVSQFGTNVFIGDTLQSVVFFSGGACRFVINKQIYPLTILYCFTCIVG